MDILRYILLVVEGICCLLLIILILVQKTKSEGLGLAFGAGMGETLFGSRAGNVLTKLTVVFAIVFLANTLFLSVLFSGHRGQSLMGRFIRSTPGAPMQAAPQRAPQSMPPASAVPSDGAPTLPGADWSQPSAPAAPAPTAQAVPAEE